MNGFIAKFSGKSMQPTLKEGMEILVDKVSPVFVRPGDIITYTEDGHSIVHRVIRILKQSDKITFVTKGDNHAYIDVSLVPQDLLSGKVQAAFYPDARGKDVLLKNRFIKVAYVVMGNLALSFRSRREFFPQAFRSLLKPVVGIFFFCFKKSIHLTYSALKYEYLFFRQS
jgi:signal peptidase I